MRRSPKQGSARKPASRLATRSTSFGRWLRRLAGDLRPRWRGLPPNFKRSLLISLAIALAIEGLLHMAHHHPRLVKAQDEAMDWMINLYRNVQPQRAEPVSFTLLDIDEETFRRWGSPLYVPRDKLALLMKTVVEAGPKVVIVDVGLATASGTPGDDELKRLLARWAAVPAEGEAPIPLLVLLASFQERHHGGQSAGAEDHSTGIPALERRSSFLEPEVEAGERILWASPLFALEPDWTVRRWRLWQAACTEGSVELEILPSIQLLVAALLAEPATPPGDIVHRVESTIAASTAQGCAPDAESQGATGNEATHLEIGGHSISLASTSLSQRIVFRYPARAALREGERYPVNSATGSPMLDIVPAYPITAGQSVDSSLFRDRIVIIGGSFAAGRDVHRTPLGVMPGALVIVNAMDSLFEFGQLEPLAWPARYGITIVLVIIMSVVFTFFQTFKGALVAVIVLGISLLPLSVAVFKAGYWIDFGVPLLAVYLHKMAGEIEKVLGHGPHAKGGKTTGGSDA